MQSLSTFEGFSEGEVTRALFAPERHLRFRYELLDDQDSSKGFLTNVVNGGSVEHSFLADIKGTASFVLSESYDDDGIEIDYQQDRIKPWVGLRMPDGTWIDWPQGVYLISAPKRTYKRGVIQREITGYDKSLILNEDVFATRFSLNATETVVAQIGTILDDVNLEYDIPDSYDVFPVKRSWDLGISKLQIVNDLLASLNYRSLTMDENGIARSEPYLSPDDEDASFIYATDANSVIFDSFSDEFDSYNVANRWVFVVSQPDRGVLRCILSNDDPASPTSTVSRGRTITDFRDDSDEASASLLQAKAQRAAREASHVFRTVEFSTAIMPFHGDRDVYFLQMEAFGLNEKFAETVWTLPFEEGGEMKHSARHLVNIDLTVEEGVDE